MSAAATTSPASQALPVWRDPAAWAKTSDIVAVLIALSLPWSTSLVGIFAAIWLVTVAPTLDFRRFLQSLKRPICCTADCAVRAGACGYAVVGRALGRAFLCPEPGDETTGAAAIVLSFRTLDARHVGVDRLSGLLHAPDGDVLDGAALSRPFAQAWRRRRARHLRQELHRPEPGIRIVRDTCSAIPSSRCCGTGRSGRRCC